MFTSQAREKQGTQTDLKKDDNIVEFFPQCSEPPNPNSQTRDKIAQTFGTKGTYVSKAHTLELLEEVKAALARYVAKLD